MRGVTRLIFAVPIAVTILLIPGIVEATPATGYTATTIVSGPFGGITSSGKLIIPDCRQDDRRAKAWLSQRQKASTLDLYVQNNVWQPGGSTGWHAHINQVGAPSLYAAFKRRSFVAGLPIPSMNDNAHVAFLISSLRLQNSNF